MNITFMDNLKQALVDEGIVTVEQLRVAESTAQRENKNLTSLLIKSGLLAEEQLASFIGEKMHVPYVNLNNYTIDRKMLELIPEKIARRHNVIPLFKIEEVVTVAMPNPLGMISIDDISAVARCPVEAVIASEESIKTAIDQWYGIGESRKGLINQLAEEFEILGGGQEEESQYSLKLAAGLYAVIADDEAVPVVVCVLAMLRYRDRFWVGEIVPCDLLPEVVRPCVEHERYLPAGIRA